MKRIVQAFALCISGPLVVLACGETPVAKPQSSQQSATAASAAASAAPSASANHVEYTENDFVENENNRDPFHSYIVQTVPREAKVQKIQVKVKLAEYAVDELKLAAIVQAGTGTRAMFMPPNGMGISVFPGEYIGRADVVHTGGSNGSDYQINWRVDKIRDGEVILIREDRAYPTIPPSTRVILLHPETTDKKG